MKLFLTSSTIENNLVKPFEELIGKSIHGLNVIFIPDAAYGIPDQKDISWVEEERQFLVDEYEWEILDLVLRDIKKVDIGIFDGIDVIFVNGGFSGYLVKEMRRTGFDTTLPKLLKRGIVYVGSSAGSMVMSDIQDASSWYIGEPEPEAIDIPGLGYIDFQIYPHVNKENIKKIKEIRSPKFKYYLLEDGHAISFNGNEMKLHGANMEILEKKSS